MSSIEEQTKNLEDKIQKLEEKILKLEEKINKLEGDKETKTKYFEFWKTEKSQLQTEKNNLQAEKNNLQVEKNNLQAKELLLLERQSGQFMTRGNFGSGDRNQDLPRLISETICEALPRLISGAICEALPPLLTEAQAQAQEKSHQALEKFLQTFGEMFLKEIRGLYEVPSVL